MIKEGLNPLDTPISELNDQIDRIREQEGITSFRISVERLSYAPLARTCRILTVEASSDKEVSVALFCSPKDIPRRNE